MSPLGYSNKSAPSPKVGGARRRDDRDTLSVSSGSEQSCSRIKKLRHRVPVAVFTSYFLFSNQNSSAGTLICLFHVSLPRGRILVNHTFFIYIFLGSLNMAVSDPPPSSPTPQRPSLAVARGTTPTGTAVRAYLQPVTSLDSESLDTLKSLLRITVDLRRNTSRTHRIRRGSPGAGALGATLASLQPRLEEIANRVSEVLKTHQDFPGMYQISRQFPEFRDILNGRFNDGGNDPGYNERVHLLEKLMYVAGTLRGHVELVLEQHAYWRAKLSGEKSSRLARRLDFDLAVDPAAVGEEQSVNETALAAKDSLQRELPSSDQTFKGKVNGGNFGHWVIHGHNSLFKNKRKIHICIFHLIKALTNLPPVFCTVNNFEAGVLSHVQSYLRVQS